MSQGQYFTNLTFVGVEAGYYLNYDRNSYRVQLGNSKSLFFYHDLSKVETDNKSLNKIMAVKLINNNDMLLTTGNGQPHFTLIIIQ